MENDFGMSLSLFKCVSSLVFSEDLKGFWLTQLEGASTLLSSAYMEQIVGFKEGCN